MAWAPLIDQRALSPDGPEDCFETCLASVLQHLGHNITPQQILAAHAGVTDISVGLQLCAQFGLKGCAETQGSFNNNDKYAICLIHDNGYANPDVHGSFEHFIVVYAQDASNVYAFNPWGARDIAYPLSEFNPAYQAAILVPASANRAGDPVNPPSQGGAAVDTNSLVQAVIRQAWWGIGRGEPDAQGLSQYTSAAISGNVDQVVASLRDSPEGANWSNRLSAAVTGFGDLQNRVAALEQRPAGGVGPQGPPGPPGPQGLPGASITTSLTPPKTGLDVSSWLPSVTTWASLVATGATWAETVIGHNVSPAQAVTLTTILAAVARGATAVENALGAKK